MKSFSGFVSKHAPFLRWWLMFTAMCVSGYFVYSAGIINRFLEVDVTNISLVIFGIFVLFTLITGLDTFKINKSGYSKAICTRAKAGWFFADALMTLGMLGTVVGFILMLESDITVAKTALTNMSKGMGVALYTTAAGVVLGLLLKLQLFNLGICIEEYEKQPKNTCSCKE